MASTSKILLGIVGAAAAGVVVGLLLAPEKGSDLREKINKKTGGIVDHITGFFSHDGDSEMGETEDIGKEMPQGA